MGSNSGHSTHSWFGQVGVDVFGNGPTDMINPSRSWGADGAGVYNYQEDGTLRRRV